MRLTVPFRNGWPRLGRLRLAGMSGGRRWALGPRLELEDGAQSLVDVVALGQQLALLEGNPGAWGVSAS